mmetsp:Transcript_27104/g.40588  ORF Transcript_27104/g.40588 Transcript_27104/m.40588 type:complete len:135 (-) Transcript_27104:1428-1832(-)
MGGKEGKNSLTSVEVYSQTSRKWTSLPTLQTKRSHCAAVSMGGQICVMGGHDGKHNHTSVEVYSPTSRKWTSLPPMKTKRSGCTAVSVGGQVCVMGGYGGGSEISSVEVLRVIRDAEIRAKMQGTMIAQLLTQL